MSGGYFYLLQAPVFNTLDFVELSLFFYHVLNFFIISKVIEQKCLKGKSKLI